MLSMTWEGSFEFYRILDACGLGLPQSPLYISMYGQLRGLKLKDAIFSGDAWW